MDGLWKLYKRFNFYALFGISTFVLDLAMVGLLIRYGIPEYPAIVGSFLFAVTINFFLSYRFVFKGTTQTLKRGYAYFIGIALIGLLVVGPGTLLLHHTFGLSFYLARIVIGGVTGVANFLLNNFLNFKMGLR